MLTARRRAVKKKHPTRRRKQGRTQKGVRRLHRAKRYTLKGGGNSNNNGNSKSAGSKAAAAAENEDDEEDEEEEEEEEDEEEEEEEVKEDECKDYSDDEDMIKSIEKWDGIFDKYYQKFFKKADAHIDGILAHLQNEKERLDKATRDITNKTDLDKIIESVEELRIHKDYIMSENKGANIDDTKKYILGVLDDMMSELQEYKDEYSLQKLLDTLKEHTYDQIKANNDRLSTLAEYNNPSELPVFQWYQSDLPSRLPTLPENIRVWRTLKGISSSVNTGDILTHDPHIYGVAATSYEFDKSIFFGFEDRAAICLEITIPKGECIALPINSEVLYAHAKAKYTKGKKKVDKNLKKRIENNALAFDEREIIILGQITYKIGEQKCIYYDHFDKYTRQYKTRVEVYACEVELDIRESDFTPQDKDF
jgi:hypothetical protein